jgi:hypothetical protein
MSHKKEDSSPAGQARKAFRSGATRRPMTEYEKEQKALQKKSRTSGCARRGMRPRRCRGPYWMTCSRSLCAEPKRKIGLPHEVHR